MWVVWLAGCPRETAPPDPCSAPDAPTWENFARGYVTTWCTPCHSSSVAGDARNGAPDGVDFDDWAWAYTFRDAIAARATGEAPSMPPLGGVDPGDVDLLERWLACGARGADPPADPCAEPVSGPAATIGSQADADALCATSNRVAGLTVNGGARIACLCGVDGDLVLTAGELDLPAVTEVTGDLVASGGSLVAPSLARVDGDLVGSGTLSALSVPALGSVGGDVRLTDLTVLGPVSFDALLTVGGQWLVARSATVTRVDLPRLRTVGGDFVQEDLPGLTELAGTRALAQVGGHLVLHRMPKLVVLDDWSFLLLGEVGGDVVIEDNLSLVAIHGFTTLADTSGDVRVERNAALVRIDGFDLLVHVAGDVRIAANPRQLHLIGFVNLEQIDGELVLEDLPAIGSVAGLSTVRDVGGLRLTRVGSPAVLEFTALEAVGGDLVVEGSPSMVRIDGFDALGAVGGDIRLVDNLLLTAIDGWWSIETVGGSVEARDNPALPTSTVEAWIDEIGVENVGGTVTIIGNGPG